jgi:hypothetical protein
MSNALLANHQKVIVLLVIKQVIMFIYLKIQLKIRPHALLCVQVNIIQIRRCYLLSVKHV